MRYGGMQCNGLRQSTEVVDYFSGPGRQNIIADPPPRYMKLAQNNDPGGRAGPLYSIGEMQYNGMKTPSDEGPGTLKSSFLAVTHPRGITDESIGEVLQNDKRTQYEDPWAIQPFLVEALRNCPLSIYAKNDEVKRRDIPAFFAYIRPENYDTYKSSPRVEISTTTVNRAIHGNPQVNVLGLAEQNPLMGITTGIPNEHPTFNGKVYGGSNDGSAKQIAEELYAAGWYDPYADGDQSGQSGGRCFNKEGVYFAPGYNVAPQINSNRYPTYVPPHQATTQIPWGPRRDNRYAIWN